MSDEGLDYQSVLNLSLLCVSWTKINFYENKLQDKIVETLVEIEDSLNYENIQEVCKILWSFSNSEYSNESLIVLVNKYVRQEIDKLNVNNILDILLSIAFFYPNEVDLISYLLQVRKY